MEQVIMYTHRAKVENTASNDILSLYVKWSITNYILSFTYHIWKDDYDQNVILNCIFYQLCNI